MARKSTIKLLLINKSDNEGERLVGLFRNAGRVARAQRAGSAEALLGALEKDHWDLIIADDKHPSITPEQCLQQVKQVAVDIPVIVIRENSDDIQSAIDAGACDIISSSDEQRLTFAALREINNLEQRRNSKQLAEQLNDVEARCELLLAQSQDAIAYVADGMLISANALFAERFGYEDSDELDCLPIIDLIGEQDQNNFKALLKAQLASDDRTDFRFTGCQSNGDDFAACMQMSNATLDDEPCVQLTIGDDSPSGSTATGNSPDIDPATGLYSHDYFLSQLDSQLKQAASSASSLLYIGLDNFNGHRSRLGISSAEAILLDIASFIQSQAEQSSQLAHYCDDGFTMLLPNTDIDSATRFATDLCKSVSEHILDVADQSMQCSISIGVSALDKQAVEQAPKDLIDAVFGASEQARENGGNRAEQHTIVRERKAMGDAKGDDELDKTIEEALDDGHFKLMFQPVVSLRGSAGDHYEVQVLMTDEQGQEVGASEFLRGMKFSGFNTRLDRWVILEATKMLAAERDRGHDVRLFMNLTANALHDESLLPWLNVALKAGGLPPESLNFQFEETDLNSNLKPAINFSGRLKDSGCKLSIAGFGASESPFKLLKQVEAKYITLAADITASLSGDTSDLKSMVSTAKETDTQTIVPGIQNASALAVLWQIGADYIQGDYLATPGPEMNYEFTDIA